MPDQLQRVFVTPVERNKGRCYGTAASSFRAVTLAAIGVVQTSAGVIGGTGDGPQAENRRHSETGANRASQLIDHWFWCWCAPRTPFHRPRQTGCSSRSVFHRGTSCKEPFPCG